MRCRLTLIPARRRLPGRLVQLTAVPWAAAVAGGPAERAPGTCGAARRGLCVGLHRRSARAGRMACFRFPTQVRGCGSNRCGLPAARRAVSCLVLPLLRSFVVLVCRCCGVGPESMRTSWFDRAGPSAARASTAAAALCECRRRAACRHGGVWLVLSGSRIQGRERTMRRMCRAECWRRGSVCCC